MPMTATDTTLDPIELRVQALLNKAESSQFPEEAEAFLAKAQELVTAHSIDMARLSLLAVAQISRDASAGAAYIVVTESDQEGCGLTGIELLDADRERIFLNEDQRSSWDDGTTSILWNLTDDVEDVWSDFHTTTFIDGDVLIIDKILTAAATWDLP